jgi:hypothetical protein
MRKARSSRTDRKTLVNLSRSEYPKTVRMIRSIFAGALLAMFTASPSLACLSTFSQMNEAEMACCKKMAYDCGAMKNAEHSCCQKTSVFTNDKVLISGVQRLSGITAPASHLPAFRANIPVLQQSYEVHWQSHSPPIPGGSSLVLRI